MKVYQQENQFIIRFPENVANQIHHMFQSNQLQSNIQIKPYIQFSEQGQLPRFNIKVQGNQYKGTVMDLPTITQSFKTIDNINLFKSNDISQLIYVTPKKQQPPSQLYDQQIYSQKRSIIRKKLKDGLTTPTKDIRHRYYRKKGKIEPKIINEVEKELLKINEELKNIQNKTQSCTLKQHKRKYQKKF